MSNKKLNEITGFHGTSYDFNKFNHKKYLNTGDGSQEFGWGTYVTDNKDVATEYADRSRESNTGNYDKNNERITAGRLKELADYTITTDPNVQRSIVDHIRMIMYGNNTLDKETIEKERKLFLSKVNNNNVLSSEINLFFNELLKLEPYMHKAQSFIYEVQIPDNNGSNYIFWYEPLQSDANNRINNGLSKLKNRFNVNGYAERIFSNVKTGCDLYKNLANVLGSPKAASLFLLNCCGYEGIVYPIGTIYDFEGEDGFNYVIFDASKVKINNKTIAEGKIMNLNEWWKPEFYDKLPEKIRLYHGTDMMALNDIIEEGIISAYNGHRHGETHGVNWFSLELTGNYGHGTYFSIEVPKSDFENHVFHFMNNSDVTSENREIPIDKYNLRIEKIGGMDEEGFKWAWERMKQKGGKDVFDFVEYLNKVNREFKEWLPTVDYPVVIRLIQQIFGDEPLKNAGIVESKLYINEVDASDVNLSSFKVKNELNDRFWINNKLNSKVREKLLDIADDFIDDLSIPNFRPKDIVFTGSLANYNWSRFSDIDVHIIVSFKEIYKKTEMIDDYFKSKKEIWNQTHEGIRIYGYPVEISVENEDDPGVSSGVYSLVKNKWVVEPDNFDDARLNEKYIKEFAAKVMTDIDNIEKHIKKETSNSKLDELNNKTMTIFKRLKNMRKEGLDRSGEMSSGNIIYKLLRRTKYLDKIWDIINGTYNKINSIK